VSELMVPAPPVTNPVELLTNPVQHDLAVLLLALRYGRPVAEQNVLDLFSMSLGHYGVSGTTTALAGAIGVDVVPHAPTADGDDGSA
jgi:hypothetical protein